MVWRTLLLRCKDTTPAISGYSRSHFIDRLRLTVAGGGGGSGYPKINGVGGRGGDVYLEAKEKAKLQHILQKYPDRKVKAQSGANSKGYALIAKNGNDTVIEVPPGVMVMNEEKENLGDLVTPGERLLVAKGGEGGSPRNNFNGKKGKQALITLYLKLIADIGFVGFPNAGKSTLLRGLSRAKPKVASYPFTTIRPNIGIMEFDDFRRITCADLPGLIEGAHENIGLGHNFLRHVERTNLLLFVVDIGGFQLNERAPHRNAYETVMSLNKELELYRADLLDKPAVLAVNKMDTAGAKERFEELKELIASDEAYEALPEGVKPQRRMSFRDTVGIIARDMDNVSMLKDMFRAHLDELYEASRAAEDAARKPIEIEKLNRQLM